MIQLEAVTKSYGAHEAVSDLSFEIQRGECVGLLGLNGAGKSTTLKMLAGLLNPTSGQIRANGIDVTDAGAELRKQIGFLPERPPLYAELTVREQLEFAGGLRSMSKAALRERIGVVSADCDLQRVLDVPLGTLSHGFRQRTGIAQAIVHQPQLVILDEPTQGLDPMQIAEVRALIRRLRGNHTILLSTHILTEIEAVCDRILVLHEGRVAAEGTEAELVQRFGGSGRSVEVELGAAVQVKERVEVALSSLLCQHEWLQSDAHGLRLRVSAAQDMRAQLSRALVQADLDLLSLRPVHSGLEEMFNSLGERAQTPKKESV